MRSNHGSTAWIAATMLFLVHGAAAHAQCPDNVPHVSGTWTTLPYQMPINPISATVLHNGRVLLVAGSENDAANHSSGAAAYRNAVWDPTGVDGSSVVVEQLYYDVFCSGTAQLPHGRTLIVGGSADYSFTGDRRASIYDPLTGVFAQSHSMANGRWYATATALGDGRIMALSGLGSNGSTNNTTEIYDLRTGTGWGTPIVQAFSPPLFPRLFLLPTGRVFYTGQGSGGRNPTGYMFDPGPGTWSPSLATRVNREYGACVLLPLLPPSYTPRVTCMGGGNPALQSTEIVDLSAGTLAWANGPDMSTGRIQMNAVLLPDGRVLASGGSVDAEAPNAPGRTADLYTFGPPPDNGTMASGGTASFSRLYHSTAVLLPDATVASMGSNPGDRGNYLGAIEIYKPPYLFDSQDRLIVGDRPAIVDVTPSLIRYGGSFAVTYDATNPIASAVLVRPGSTTHAFDMEQRVVGLCGPSPQPACGGGGTLSLTAPPNGNVAPPGYYMLFLLDTNAVPSVATFVELTPYSTAPPDGAISSPASDATVTAGQSVAFDTSSTAATYSWVFPGGTPAKSNAHHPGSVTYSAAGEYMASLTLIDSNSNSDPSPPTRKIKVLPASANFEIAVDPQSRLIQPGESATFNVTVTSRAGFNGQVNLSVGTEGNLPAGVSSGGFSPSSITGSGTSTLTMDTTTDAVPYALSLTVQGTSGSLVHAAATSLLVNLEAPQGVAASRSDTEAQITWLAPVGANSYTVQRSLSSGGPYETVGCTTSLDWTDTGLVPDTTYFYVAIAEYTGGPDAGGSSAPSAEVVAQRACPPPLYSGEIRAAKTVGGEVMWSWTSGGADSYDLVRGNLDTLRSTGGDFTASLDAVPSDENACLADDTSGLEIVDPYGPPADGTGEFVVLRPVDVACPAHGTYDSVRDQQPASRDPGIAGSSRACP